MKKILVLLVLFPSLSFAKIVIGFSQSNFAEPWRQAMNQEIKDALKKYPDAEIHFADAAQDNSKQVAQVENFLRQKVDVLLISPNEAKPLTSVVKKAYEAKIPVVVLDRKIVGDSYTAFIGADNKRIGREAGTFAANLAKGKKEFRVVEIWGLAGSTPAIERSQGFHEIVDKHSNIKVIHSAHADWLRDKARTQMDMVLKANNEIDLVYAHNDPMAFGAYLSARAQSREKQMQFIGIDALPGSDGGIKMVQDGKLAASFVYPTGGEKAVEIAMKAARGQQVPKNTVLETKTVVKQ